MPAPETLTADVRGIERAAELLRDGALVAFPTETVYGLGAVATDDRAVAQVFAAKGRPAFNPLIVHVPDINRAEAIGAFDDIALRLAGAFWPGPLTLVVPLRASAGISPLVTAGLSTVAIRVPEHPLARALLGAVDAPVAAPSANPSGRISPTTAQHVIDGLSDRVAAVLDGGPCQVGLESTIFETGNAPRLLRPGGLPMEALEACLGGPLTRPSSNGPVTSPGQLVSHYAPKAELRLNAMDVLPGEVLLGFGQVKAAFNLSPTGDLIEAAGNLFRHLHALDATGAKAIAVSPIPNTGLGLAINDRLSRAAAPRDQA
ncbi:MAG: L-threonylcarbamoyladenylate synthase [Pseudomonadota bacterium]